MSQIKDAISGGVGPQGIQGIRGPSPMPVFDGEDGQDSFVPGILKSSSGVNWIDVTYNPANFVNLTLINASHVPVNRYKMEGNIMTWHLVIDVASIVNGASFVILIVPNGKSIDEFINKVVGIRYHGPASGLGWFAGQAQRIELDHTQLNLISGDGTFFVSFQTGDNISCGFEISFKVA